MKKENKVILGAQVKPETKEKYQRLLKESGFKADMFITIMLDLFEQNQEREEKDHE